MNTFDNATKHFVGHVANRRSALLALLGLGVGMSPLRVLAESYAPIFERCGITMPPALDAIACHGQTCPVGMRCLKLPQGVNENNTFRYCIVPFPTGAKACDAENCANPAEFCKKDLHCGPCEKKKGKRKSA